MSPASQGRAASPYHAQREAGSAFTRLYRLDDLIVHCSLESAGESSLRPGGEEQGVSGVRLRRPELQNRLCIALCVTKFAAARGRDERDAGPFSLLRKGNQS